MRLVWVPYSELDKEFIENLHKSTFEEYIEGSFFRFDYALMTIDDSGEVNSYCLARELDSDTAELSWGGTIVEKRGYASRGSMEQFADEMLKRYPIVTFQTANTNTKMIRLGLVAGFKIEGIRQAWSKELFLIFVKKKGE